MFPSSLQHWDEKCFSLVHVDMANPAFDLTMPFVRNPYCWAPVYLFVLIFMWQRYKTKGLIWCLFFILCFGFADFISASIIKPYVSRLRPCNDENLQAIIRPLVHCGSGFSFPSTHASNHFALSFFIIFTIARKNSLVILLCLLWAILVCFAQVYVGVHYPIDVAAGALLGILIAKFNASYFQLRCQL
jgi:membrane-associated phospholipid phosphatase